AAATCVVCPAAGASFQLTYGHRTATWPSSGDGAYSVAGKFTNEEAQPMNVKDLKTRRMAALDTPSGLSSSAAKDITGELNALLADTFALYMKTKNFHWHMSGPHFRDYHLLLDEQAGQLENSVDILAERVRRVGGSTIRSIGHIAKLQRIKDNDKDYVPAIDMLLE